MKTILVTGGTGFIGSHTCVELLQAGYNVIILDNLVNSKESSIDRIKQITDRDVKFYKTDLLDFEGTKRVFEENDIDAVIHFAGLKAVGESVEKPLEYYENNIGGTLTAVLGAVEPITAVCVGILVFSEPFTPNLAVGILLIIIAVTMIILSKSIQGTLRKIYRKAAHFQVSK